MPDPIPVPITSPPGVVITDTGKAAAGPCMRRRAFRARAAAEDRRVGPDDIAILD